MEAIVFISLTSVSVLVGIAIIVSSFRERQKVLQAQRWTTTIAELTRVELVEVNDGDGLSWEVLLDYTYNLRSISYQGHTLAFGYGPSGSPDYHRRIYELLKNKTRIRIFYNPRSPHESVISAQSGTAVLVGMTVGIFFIVFGPIFFLAWIGMLQGAIAMIILTVTLFIVVAFTVYWSSLRKNDPLLKDLAN